MAHVRDDDRFFSPLVSKSEGIAVDFQVGVNDYLYGARFMSYLALKYGPEKFVQWQSRSEDSKAFYAAQFRHVFGRRLDDVWNDWIAFEHEYQKANLARLAQYPLTATQKLSPRGLGSMSRGFIDTKTNSLIAAFRYPGTIGFIGRMDLATGKLTKLQEIKGMMLYKVTSVAFDPEARTAYYTEDNGAFRDLIAVNVDNGRKRMLLKDARIGDLAFDRADKSIWGNPPRERPGDDRSNPDTLCGVQPGPQLQILARSRSTSMSRRTAIWSPLRSVRSTASRQCAFGRPRA